MGNKHSSGFISLEALVAFAILTMVLVAVYQSFSSIYLSINRLSEKDIVMAEVSSLLEGVGITSDIKTGISRGVLTSGRPWTMQTTKIEQNGEEGVSSGLERYWVKLTANDRNGKEIVFIETILIDGITK